MRSDTRPGAVCPDDERPDQSGRLRERAEARSARSRLFLVEPSGTPGSVFRA